MFEFSSVWKSRAAGQFSACFSAVQANVTLSVQSGLHGAISLRSIYLFSIKHSWGLLV